MRQRSLFHFLKYTDFRSASQNNFTKEGGKDDIKAWLNEQLPKVLPKSSIGKAIGYMLNQWPKLQNYLLDGRLEIDNNLVENAIRPVAMGRENYLFAGSHERAKRAALVYSLVATAKLHEVEPFEYLKDIIGRILDYPHSQLSNLLPANQRLRRDPDRVGDWKAGLEQSQMAKATK